MNKPTPRFTTVHYGAAAFAAAFFSLVAVLAVIGGTTSAQETRVSDVPLAAAADDSIDVAAAPEVETELESGDATENEIEDHFRPRRRGPDRRFGPPSFEDIDANNDDIITPDEFREFQANRPGPRGRERTARREFDGPPRGPRGDHEFRGGPGGRGPGEFRGGPGRHGNQGPPPHARGGRGPGEFRGGPGGHGQQGPPPRMRGGHGPGHGGPQHHGGPDAEFRGGPRGHHGPPPHKRGGYDDRGPREFERGPHGGGEFGPPPRPKFDDLDANGDGSISEQEFQDFRPPRGPRGRREAMPREESF